VTTTCWGRPLKTLKRHSFFGRKAGYSNITASANSFVGYQSGYSNTSGNNNSFFGSNAGFSNTTGNMNSFFGNLAGLSNGAGSRNSFFGNDAGGSNTSGEYNAFFGATAGELNSSGSGNNFFGDSSGWKNTIGSGNSFFGDMSGGNNTTGGSNSFWGSSAGLSNTTGANNSSFGAYSDVAAGITNATAVGYRTKVTQSNSLVLGSINGVNGATADTNVGIGKTAPTSKLDIADIKSGVLSGAYTTNNLFSSWNPSSSTDAYVAAQWIDLRSQGSNNFTNSSGLTMQYQAFTGYGTGTITRLNGLRIYLDAYNNNVTGAYGIYLDPISATGAGSVGNRYGIYQAGTGDKNYFAGNIGIGTTNPTERLYVNGNVWVTGNWLGPSDARLKQAIKPLNYGLSEVLRLRPVSFEWKDRNDGKLNLGLIAQEVAPVIPEIVEKSKDEAGTMGMNYSALIPVLIKAVQEQQSVIQTQIAFGQEQQSLIQVQKSELEQKNEEIAALNARLSALEQAVERLTKLGGLK
jgi:trimeric autotransporter adhesin